MIKNGSWVRFKARTGDDYEFGEVWRSEKLMNGKTEYHVSIDTGGMMTAMEEDLTVIPEQGKFEEQKKGAL